MACEAWVIQGGVMTKAGDCLANGDNAWGYVCRLLFSALLIAAGGGVRGQTMPDPARLREQLNVPPATSSTNSLPEMTGNPTAGVPAGLQAIRVWLQDISIEGNTALTAADLERAFAAYRGREVTGTEIFALAQSLTTQYRNAGYFLSTVVVPPQSLAQGRLTLRVIEGYVSEVFIEADEKLRPFLVQIGERIRHSRPLRADVLERYLLTAQEVPGLQLRSVLTPSKAPGAADLTLVARLRRLEGQVSLDNYGTRYLGPNQVSVGLALNQVLTPTDQLRYLGAGSGDTEMSYHQLTYSKLLDEQGWRLGATLFQARTQPGDTLAIQDIRGRADGVSLQLSYPLQRTRHQSAWIRLAFDSTDIDTDVLGVRTVEDRIRVLRLGWSWQRFDRWDGSNSLDVDYSQGVGGTSRSDLLKSRVGADGLFSKWTFEYTRQQPLADGWSLHAGVAGQWTGDTPLLSSEQFALGGRRYGRAYEPAELVGDRALALRLESRRNGRGSWPGLQAYQGYVFYDLGQVTQLGVLAADAPATRSLASAGVGVRLSLFAQITAQLEAAWPLTRPLSSAGEQGKAARLLGALSMRF